jgi:MerR family transcriptional regulator/heat shock protein HspR
MKRYVRLDEAIEVAGLTRELAEELVSDEVIETRATLEQERVISSAEADELRVARTLVDELGVNVAGVEVILHMRRRQLELRRELDAVVREIEAVHAVEDELRRRLGPAALLPPPVE